MLIAYYESTSHINKMIDSNIYTHFYLQKRYNDTTKYTDTQTRSLKSTENTLVNLKRMKTPQEYNIIQSNFCCGRWDLTKEENDYRKQLVSGFKVSRPWS